MGKGCLVCFTGVDGSGKTTHARSLLEFLNEDGHACRYVWAASRPILSLAFFAFTRLLGYWKKTKKGDYTDPLEFAPTSLRAKLGLVWRVFIFIDFQIKVSVTIRPLLLLGRTVVCDRYVYDVFTELYLSKFYTSRFGALLWTSIPKPVVTFLLDIQEETATSRRSIPSERLSAKRQAFLKIAKIFKVVVINSDKDFCHNSKQIRKHALRLLAK